MTQTLLDLEPKGLWRHFHNICNIPRPSRHEQQMIQYVSGVARDRGLKVHVDEVGNVIIKKPATRGMENRKGVVLQCHLDMVVQKNSDTQHDFEKDPIQSYVDGDWVKARGTTLGADNGMGVSAALAILEATDLPHGPLEALFTVEEESSMRGAFGLKAGLLDAEIMLNLDSEDEEEFCIGCAGGIDTIARLRYQQEAVNQGHVALKIALTGLKGGHSGLDIHLGRANANKLLNRFLLEVYQDLGARLASIEGGTLRNAIPREAFATVVVPVGSQEKFKNALVKFEAVIRSEFSQTEDNIRLEALETFTPSSLMDEVSQVNLMRAISACANGVLRMNPAMKEVVETSTNLGVVKSGDGEVEIITLQRSPIETAKQEVAAMVRHVFELAGARAESVGSYPGWNPCPDSEILKLAKPLYEKKFARPPRMVAIHAGLECGLIGNVYPHLDTISFGPTIRSAHSPDEMVNIPSVARFWDFFVAVLGGIPESRQH